MERELIKNFEQITGILNKENKYCRVAVIEGYDEHTQEAISRALKEDIAEFYLVGDSNKLNSYIKTLSLYKDKIHVINAETDETSATLAVNLIRTRRADCIMKGLISTDILLKALLNKDTGILKRGHVLTHIGAMKIPTYNKMLFVSDSAVIPFPTLQQRIEMIKYAINVCHNFGIEQPRIALIHCTEKISPKFPITIDYQQIVDMAKKGLFGNAIIDGPIDVKCACSKNAAEIKGINSPINGLADVLIMPDIEAANAFYKALTTFLDTDIADALQGAECPVVLTSRSDSSAVKFDSLVMACLTC
jgi:phosphate butyryltransferase